MTDIVERLDGIVENIPPIILSRKRQDELETISEAADTIAALRARVAELEGALAEARETMLAFAGPWATQYARDFGLTNGHLHPTHYDILAKAGARMDDFTRAALGDKA